MKNALILGASGLVGGHVLQLLLADNRYEKVISLGRKELAIKNKKLTQITCNLFELESQEHWFNEVDDLFICIGTTKAKTPNNETYFSIDFGIPVEAAKIAHHKNVPNLAVVSALGANAKSSIFYNATKGKMEEAISGIGFKNLIFVRPSLLVGNRSENRTGEGFATVVMKSLAWAIPKKYKAIHAETVAKAMVLLVNSTNKKSIWLNHELEELVKNNQN